MHVVLISLSVCLTANFNETHNRLTHATSMQAEHLKIQTVPLHLVTQAGWSAQFAQDQP